jgi:hypothetical protein
MNQYLSKLSRGNDELGDEIYGIITITTKFRWRRLVWSKLAVKLRGLKSQLPTSS